MVIDHGSRQLHVRMVAEGDHHLLFLEEDCAEIPAERLAHLGLSPRETQILGWIVHGKSNPEIATILSISVRTIHKHVEHVYLKLGVENRHAAIVRAMQSLRDIHPKGMQGSSGFLSLSNISTQSVVNKLEAPSSMAFIRLGICSYSGGVRSCLACYVEE